MNDTICIGRTGRFVAIALLMAFLSSLPALAAAPAMYSFGNESALSGTDIEFVMATFVTTTQPVSITHIGIWDRGGDGLTESHGFRIYDEDNGVDLLNTVFPAASGVLMDKFRYIDVPDIAVPANRNLIVLAHEPNLLGANSDLHTYGLNDVVFDPRFTFRSAAFQNGAGINTTFPNQPSSLLAGPNLLFAIPEPASVIIAIAGFSVLGLSTRRRRT